MFTETSKAQSISNTNTDSAYEPYNSTSDSTTIMHYNPTVTSRYHYNLTTPVTDSPIHNIQKRSQKGKTTCILVNLHPHL